MITTQLFEEVRLQLMYARQGSGSSAADPRERIGNMLVREPNLLSEHRRIGLALLRAKQAPDDWIDDIAQDFAVWIQRAFCRNPGLKLHSIETRSQFEAWIRGVMRNRCHKDIERCWRQSRRSARPEKDFVVDGRAIVDLRLDLKWAIEAEGGQDTKALWLALAGQSLDQIAKAMGWPRRTTYRRLRKLLRRLQIRLHAYRDSLGREEF